MDSFSDEERYDLIKELISLRAQALHWSDYNHGWEIGFRVTIALMSSAVAICSGIAALDSTNPSVRLSATSGILSGLVAIVSAFAFQTFDFSGLRERWAVKAAAFYALIDQLKFLKPDKAQFLTRKQQVVDYNPDQGGQLPNPSDTA